MSADGQASCARAALVSALLGWSLCAQAVTCSDPTIAPSNPDDAYIEHRDGTVTDRRSALMWKRCAEGQDWQVETCTGAAGVFDWGEALAQAQASGFAGHGDWRLPNIKELRALVEECRFGPSINDSVFPDTPSGGFWSGSPYAGGASSAWYVYFFDGFSKDFFRTFSFHVRLVRDAP